MFNAKLEKWIQGMSKVDRRAFLQAADQRIPDHDSPRSKAMSRPDNCTNVLLKRSPSLTSSKTRVGTDHTSLVFDVKTLLAKAIGNVFDTSPWIHPESVIPLPDFSTIDSYVASTLPYDAWRKGLFNTQRDQRDLVAATIKLDADCEAHNHVTNKRFNQLNRLYPAVSQDPLMSDLLETMKLELCTLFAGFTPFRTLRFAHHGNGAASNSDSPLWKKLRLLSATPSVAQPRFMLLYETLEGDLPPLEVNPAERYGTVEKTYVIRRPIGIQPSLNLYYQLGTGGWMKSQLRQIWGIDLRDQERNRSLAKEASLFDDIVTVDLTSASGLIARDMVRFLFNYDPDFLAWLEDLRVEYCDYPGSGEFLSTRFSAMGNGYTFELETAIFGAAIRAIYSHLSIPLVPGNWSVYGDDMIIVKQAYPLLQELLQFLGFKVNTSKTFSDGPFRESCGADFYNGKPVRNFFYKGDLDHETNISDFIKVLNGYYRRYLESETKQVKWRLLFIWQNLYRAVPRWFKSEMTGPPVEHDAWIISEDENLWASTHTNYNGDMLRLGLVVKDKPSKDCTDFRRLQAWFYLANRRTRILNIPPVVYHSSGSVNGPRRARDLELYISYKPSHPTGHQAMLIRAMR